VEFEEILKGNPAGRDIESGRGKIEADEYGKGPV